MIPFDFFQLSSSDIFKKMAKYDKLKWTIMLVLCSAVLVGVCLSVCGPYTLNQKKVKVHVLSCTSCVVYICENYFYAVNFFYNLWRSLCRKVSAVDIYWREVCLNNTVIILYCFLILLKKKTRQSFPECDAAATDMSTLIY